MMVSESFGRTLSASACLLLATLASSVSAQTGEMREWTDSTGKFKITAQLMEVKDGDAYLKNEAGKTIKIPIAKLSAADQAILKSSDNPFEMVDPSAGGSGVSGSATSSAGGTWSSPKVIEWSNVEELQLTPGVAWEVPLGEPTFDFEPKRASLRKKAHFWEGLAQSPVNTACKRAALGFTVSFTVPKPLTRVSLVDLVSGRAVHSEQVVGNMRPLTLLDNGSTILMKGGSDERGGYEQGTELQLWRLDGKKIVRTPSWIPHPKERKSFGKTVDAAIGSAWPITANQVLTLSNSAHLVLWNIYKREPIWHARLNGQSFGVDVSFDRKHVAIFNDKTILVCDIKSGRTLGSSGVGAPRVGWNRVRWSPSGKKLLLSSVGDLRVFDVEKGEMENEISFGPAPIATKGLAFPHEDYALLDNKLLIHLPSRIRVCEYTDAAIRVQGDVSFVALHGDSGGVYVPSQIPHPKAKETLQKAQEDPTLFLLHPGVSVGLDVSQVPGQYRQEVEQGLRKSIEASGYKFSNSSPIRAVAKITGPKTEAVSYIARGSYVVQQYDSSVRLMWQGKQLWVRNGTNIPGFLQTKGGESIQQALDRHGKKPNIGMFGGLEFPEFMQKPNENEKGKPTSSALMSSKFTLNGLVDSN